MKLSPTVNIPISTVRYPSNWELSAARATSVLGFMVEQGRVKPDLMTAVGYAEHRPIASNNHLAKRVKNRRVRIVIDLGTG